MLRHGSLFSGIGGFDYAAEMLGWQNVFHCEWNEFGRQVLHHYWPDAIAYGDITKTDFTPHHGSIDIISGGFPCQPYSAAGKRKGKDDERHLWPEMLRAIREIQPSYVVGENVRGLTNWNGGMVFDEVQADLEAKGYEVLPFLLPACAVNAPHRRDRIWFIAHSPNARSKSVRKQKKQIDRSENVANAPSHRRNRSGEKFEIEKGLQPGSEPAGQLPGRFEGLCRSGNATNPSEQRCERSQQSGKHKKENCQRQAGTHGATSQFRASTHWQNFPTQSPICGRNDGLPSELDGITFSKWRNESIKAYGNAIVPQVAYEIFKVINQMIQTP